jgi:hypothetical protein
MYLSIPIEHKNQRLPFQRWKYTRLAEIQCDALDIFMPPRPASRCDQHRAVMRAAPSLIEQDIDEVRFPSNPIPPSLNCLESLRTSRTASFFWNDPFHLE